MGFPLVTLETVNSTTIKIDQQRYLIGSHAFELQKYRSTSYGYEWDVPLFYQTTRKNGFKWLRRGICLMNVADRNSGIIDIKLISDK
ncbi:hypothetical protein ANCCAN_04651 [Ancylostoma caninum]|uniref:MATH domain-containing protein n=1 Tax=Ancylostoma caninum TaxID=29170 RepID=A0A368GY02_ANCCA|nr:hypothetical protein ANCCAN_04651 [Ancylostoma caninum]